MLELVHPAPMDQGIRPPKGRRSPCRMALGRPEGLRFRVACAQAVACSKRADCAAFANSSMTRRLLIGPPRMN